MRCEGHKHRRCPRYGFPTLFLSRCHTLLRSNQKKCSIHLIGSRLYSVFFLSTLSRGSRREKYPKLPRQAPYKQENTTGGSVKYCKCIVIVYDACCSPLHASNLLYTESFVSLFLLVHRVHLISDCTIFFFYFPQVTSRRGTAATLERHELRVGTSRFLSQDFFLAYRIVLALYFLFWSIFWRGVKDYSTGRYL